MANYDNRRYTYAQILAGNGYYMKDDQLRTTPEVMVIQAKLNTAGYNCGTPDGKFGKKQIPLFGHFKVQKGLTLTAKLAGRH